jgi:hypothetical protein
VDDSQEPALVRADGARVVNVASVMHRFQLHPYESPEIFLRQWDRGGYRTCKLAVIMWTRELQRRLGSNNVTAVTVDPGSVYSNIWAASSAFGKPPISWLLKACYSPVEDGALVGVWAATAPSVVPGASPTHTLVSSQRRCFVGRRITKKPAKTPKRQGKSIHDARRTHMSSSFSHPPPISTPAGVVSVISGRRRLWVTLALVACIAGTRLCVHQASG